MLHYLALSINIPPEDVEEVEKDTVEEDSGDEEVQLENFMNNQ